MATREIKPMADRSEENLPVLSGGGSAPVSGPDIHHGLIYKPGEGYWVRVMTVAMIALITLASAGWAYKALEAISVPPKAWDLVIKGFGGTAAVGQTVTLVSSKSGIEPADIGTAQVLSTIPNVGGESVVRISLPPSLAPGASVEDVANQTVRIGDLPAPVSSVRAVPAFDIEIVQVTAAALVLGLGAWSAFWFVGRKRGSVEFLIATDGEMRKVNWSTRREIMGSTYVVIGACVLMAVALFIIDYGFSETFKAIDLLRLGHN